MKDQVLLCYEDFELDKLAVRSGGASVGLANHPEVLCNGYFDTHMLTWCIIW